MDLAILNKITELLNTSVNMTEGLIQAEQLIQSFLNGEGCSIYIKSSGEFHRLTPVTSQLFDTTEFNALWPTPEQQQRKPFFSTDEDVTLADQDYTAVLNLPIINDETIIVYFQLFYKNTIEEPEALYNAGNCIAGLLMMWLDRCLMKKQLDDLIEFIPDPILILDRKEQVSSWNRAMEKMSGVKKENILGKGNYEHAIPFYNERRPTASNLILRPSEKWEEYYLDLKKEGDSIQALARSESLPSGPILIASKTKLRYDLTNSPAGSVHIIQDVTHEHELENTLTQTEEMYQGVSDFVGVGIALLGPQVVHSLNDNFLKLLEIDRLKISVKKILDRIDSNQRDKTETFLLYMLEENLQPSSFEFTTFLPSKGRRRFKGYAQSVLYNNARAIHFVIIDITEAVEIERRKELQQIRMYHSDRLTALGTLSAGIAHELNQPLNTIRVITDGILFGRQEGWELDTEEIYNNSEMISRQVKRMSSVIKSIRNFARDDKNKNAEHVCINEAINNVFSMLGQQLNAHNIKVTKRLEDDLPTLNTRLNLVEQVVMNLVVNAQQALDNCDSKAKHLWVKTGSRFDHIFLEVGDNGPGISDMHKKELFDPFFTTKDVGQGTGLGLAISQSIVTEFNGIIKAYNNSEGGATFFITAPKGFG